MSTTAEKIQRQVEFYFSDVNIAKDVFLKTKIAEDPEGFVSLDVLMTFNRIKSLTADAKALGDALRSSEKLVLDAEGTRVRRKDPLPESVQTDEQTVYVKPIPANSTLEELTEFFNTHGTVLAIWRRYYAGSADKNNVESRTKPSIFVVFSNKEEAEKLKANPPSFKGTLLSVQMKQAYLETKAKEAAEKNKLRKKNNNTNAASSAAPERRTPAMPEKSSYRIDGCGDVENFSDVKGLWPVEDQKGVRYVFLPSKDTAMVIFQDEETGKKMVSSAKERKALLNEKEPAIVQLTPEEEKELIAKVEKEIADRSEQHASNRGRGRGRGRGFKRSRD